jgi:hypothetical protein
MSHCFLIFFLSFFNTDLSQVRNYYEKLGEKKEYADKMIVLLNKNTSITASLKKGYNAAAEMSYAKFKMTPWAKVETFNKAKVKLEDCIKLDRNNIELRYIRLGIQKNTPSILGYNKSIKEDKDYIMLHLQEIKTIDNELFLKISAFLKHSFKLSEQEKKQTV